MKTRTFTIEEIRALGVPHDLPQHVAVADVHVSNGRWAETRRCIFQHDDAFWAVDYDRPLTEHQDIVDHGWGRCVVATRVVPARVPITTWVPADAGVEAAPAVDAWIVEVRHPAGRFRFSYRDDEYDLAQERLGDRQRRHPDAEVRLVRMTITYTVVSAD
ncbi:hypothetical protein ACIQNI_34450 [Streptomyces sp. NPDC091266]|uniref:hypothetical protein n=1 Tax=Streptomyces sp. NPDC091266 TaxID=3365978 RepID=UPI00381DF44C